MRYGLPALLLVLSPALALGQSLGDAAAKEKERRKAATTKGDPGSKVITEEELKKGKGTLANDPSIPVAVSTAETTGETKASGRSAGEGSPEGGGLNETEWRRRASEAWARLRAAEEKAKKVGEKATISKDPKWVQDIDPALKAQRDAERELNAAKRPWTSLRTRRAACGFLRAGSGSDPKSGASSTA